MEYIIKKVIGILTVGIITVSFGFKNTEQDKKEESYVQSCSNVTCHCTAKPNPFNDIKPKTHKSLLPADDPKAYHETNANNFQKPLTREKKSIIRFVKRQSVKLPDIKTDFIPGKVEYMETD